MPPRLVPSCLALLSRLVSVTLAFVFAVLASNALDLAPRAAAPETWCCCAEVGIDARCACTGDCCQHEPAPRVCGEAPSAKPARPDGATCLSPQCHRRAHAAGATLAFEPFVTPPSPACAPPRHVTLVGVPGVARALDRRTPTPEPPPDSAIA